MNRCQYLRIRVTDTCNLRCPWCHNEGGITTRTADELSPGGIARAAGLLAHFGFTKLKLAGGEPAGRQDLPEIIRLLCLIPGVELSMISNGTLLTRARLETYRAAGLRRLNITLNTLDEERYRRLFGGTVQQLRCATASVDHLLSLGYESPKINFIYLGPESDADLRSIMAFAREQGLKVRLLNVMRMPDATGAEQGSCGLTTADLIDRLVAEGVSRVYSRGDGISFPTLCFELAAGITMEIGHHKMGEAGVYRSCRQCGARADCAESILAHRLTPGGFLQPCLVREDNVLDLRPFVSGQMDERQARSLVKGFLSRL